MARVEIFTRPFCGYCGRARRVFEDRGVPYEEIDLSREPQREAEMVRRSGRFTVPQVFIDGKPVGGSSELLELERSGGLDERLEAAEAEAQEGS